MWIMPLCQSNFITINDKLIAYCFDLFLNIERWKHFLKGKYYQKFKLVENHHLGYEIFFFYPLANKQYLKVEWINVDEFGWSKTG